MQTVWQEGKLVMSNVEVACSMKASRAGGGKAIMKGANMNSTIWLMFFLAIMGGSILGISIDRACQGEYDLVFLYGVAMIAIAGIVCDMQ